MAAATLTEVPGFGYLHTWTLTSADATGDAISMPGAADRTVQFTSDAWGAATAEFQGAMVNVEARFVALTDAQGNAISKTTGQPIEVIEENAVYVRPKLTTAGSGATVVVYLFSRMGRP